MEKKGEPIKGSVFYRSFCVLCREPIRVCKLDVNKIVYCRECGLNMGVCKPKFKGDMNYEGCVDWEDLKSRSW